MFGNKSGSLLSQGAFMCKIHLIIVWILLSYYILWSSGDIVWGINTAEIFRERTLKRKNSRHSWFFFDILVQYKNHQILGPYHRDNAEKILITLSLFPAVSWSSNSEGRAFCKHLTLRYNWEKNWRNGFSTWSILHNNILM